MIIDFDQFEKVVNPQFKGGEGVTVMQGYDDGQNKIMLVTLAPGCSIGMHCHVGNSEIVYVVSGTGKMIYDGVDERLRPGLVTYCPEGHEHSLVNDTDEDLVVYAVIPQQ